MIAEISPQEFKEWFPVDPHCFISETFCNLNRSKVEKLLWLGDEERKSLGLVVGLRDGSLLSPFSAPFGGLHFRHDQVYIGEIDHFVSMLIQYSRQKDYKSIKITLPPDIYHPNINAKTVSSLIRAKFILNTPEITNWVNLDSFQYRFEFRSSREYYNQAVKHKLVFKQEHNFDEQELIYHLVRGNRERLGRVIHMSIQDLLQIQSLWPVDFFSVKNSTGEMAAGAIFYRAHSSIVFAVFWGDSEVGRPLRAMDFLLFNLWSHYKSAGYRYIDLGISTEFGVPNEGLLRFKETHECVSSLRFTFVHEF